MSNFKFSTHSAPQTTGQRNRTVELSCPVNFIKSKFQAMYHFVQSNI